MLADLWYRNIIKLDPSTNQACLGHFVTIAIGNRGPKLH